MRRLGKIAAGVIVLFLATAGVLQGETVSNAKEKGLLPVRYDLRDDGYVTPVKNQSPFSTCWSFGAIAAAECSILSSSGTTYAETVDKNGNGFDLSEKHLAWFAKKPITKYDDPSQVGEGLHTNSDDPNFVYETGGFDVLVTSLFSTGTGPVSEYAFPYCGKKGLTKYDVLKNMNEDEKTEFLKEEYEPEAKKMGKTLEQYCQYWTEEMGLADGMKDYDPVKMFFEWAYNTYLSNYKESGKFSSKDDWSIPEFFKDKDGKKYSYRNIYGGYTLKNGNVLPEFCIFDYDEKAVTDENYYGRVWKGINPSGTRAVKQELLNGRGVKMSFCADTSKPDQKGEAKYINENTWAHYTYEDASADHNVCIIGWDDTYSASNFNSAHRPPGDGAWLVKNSWGSETDYVTLKNGVRIGYDDWGIVDKNGKHTGYFWISYYDKSLEIPETFEFAKTYNDQVFYPFQYDYLPAQIPFKEDCDKPISTANVFSLDKDDPDLKISSVSAKTGEENVRALLSVYKLKKGWKKPTDGTLLYQTSKNFEYAGYHRIEIPKGEQFVVKSGETIAVINTETYLNENGKRMYTYAFNAALSKTEETQIGDIYCVGVVNKGESFICFDGEWIDWTEESKQYREEGYEVDNFSIKAFGTEVPEGEQVITAKKKTVTLKANGKKSSFAGKVKTSGNGKLTFKKKSGDKHIVVTSAGKVYAKKGIKPGTYKVVVRVTASKTKEYRSSQMDMKLTVKVK